MSAFHFVGTIPASKSLYNRALICASYDSKMILSGHSQCDDVVKMKQALDHLYTDQIYDRGEAGTVLRFLALRASRIPGTHVLKGSHRLFKRPQLELQNILNQCDVKTTFNSDHMTITSKGWSLKNSNLHVSRKESSQFISGILLNAWNLDFPLTIAWDESQISEGYWQMTTELVKDFGMSFQLSDRTLHVPAQSQILRSCYAVESDLSSAFAVAAYAALNGNAVFENFPMHSQQPDYAFLSILEKMNVRVHYQKDCIRIAKNFLDENNHPHLIGIHSNLKDCPDLFPVLATLCAFASTPSRLDGAPHLVFKESNRIEKVAELLKKIGVTTKILNDGIEIYPNKEKNNSMEPFIYETDHDHRLAFAAALVASQNYPIQISEPEVVNKSFPEFWNIIANKTTAF